MTHLTARTLKILMAGLIASALISGCGKKAGEDATPETAETSAAVTANPAMADRKVGICLSSASDAGQGKLGDALTEALIARGFNAENISVTDAGASSDSLAQQADAFISTPVDVLIVSPVQSADMPSLTDKAAAAKIPLIYINTFPEEGEQARWEDGLAVTFAGPSAGARGRAQGALAAEMTLEVLDVNGNGAIDYVLVNVDSSLPETRADSEALMKVLEETCTVNCLDELSAYGDRVTARQAAENALGQFGTQAELFVCENDTMALGAADAAAGSGRTVGTDLFIIGGNASKGGAEAVQAGTISGTVTRDLAGEAAKAAEAAEGYLAGTYTAHMSECDHMRVTAENAQEALARLG